MTTCRRCGLPMVQSGALGELWCSVYGTHEDWPWTLERRRVAARHDELVKRDEREIRNLIERGTRTV